jgi:uncharacterized protein YfcZ (UPF0381/DUF406 family)
MAKEFTPEELGIAPVQREFSPEELGLGLPEKPKTKEGVGTSLRRGAEQLVSSGQTALESVTKGGEEAARRAQERQSDIQRRLGEGASLERLKKVYEEQGLLPAAKELASQIPSAIAEQAPNIGATLGGAAAGAAAGSVLPGVGTVLGGIAGAALPSLVQQYGGNIQRQAEAQQSQGKPLDINRGVAAATAVPQAALDVVGTLVPLGGNMVSKILGPAAGKLLSSGGEKLASEALLSTLAKGTLTGIAAEVPTEVTQQMLERAQAGLSLTDKSALQEYGETAFAVSLLGPLGIIGRISDKAQAGRDLAAAKAAAANSGQPQEVPLLTYDPNVPNSRGTEIMTVFPDGRVAPSEAAGFAEKFKPQDITRPTLQLPYDPNLPNTRGQGIMYGMPSGQVAPTEEEAFKAKYGLLPQPRSITEAYAIPGDKEAIEAARWAEARAKSPAMQKINEIAAKKKEFFAKEQSALDAMKAQQSAFTNAPIEGGVIRPPSAEEIAAQEAKTASYANRVTVAAQENGKINIYEGEMNPSGKTINVIDPTTGLKKTFNPKQKNIVVDPTEKDIFAFEQQGLTTDLKTIEKEIKDAEKAVSGKATNFEEWLKKNPIKSDEISDALPNALEVRAGGKGTKIAADARKFFSKDGSPLDDLARRAVEDGVMTQEEFDNVKDTGGVNAFIRKLEAAYNKETIETPENRDAIAQIDTLYNQKEQLQQEIENQKAKAAAPTEEEIGMAQAPEFVANEPATPVGPVTPGEYAQRVPVTPSFRAQVKTPYSDKFIADGKKLAADARKSLDKMGLKDVGLKFEEQIIRRLDGKSDEISGAYMDNLIRVSLSSSDPIRTLNHEALHAMKDLGMFSQKEWTTLEDMAKSKWMDQYDIAANYGQETTEIQLEEAIAHAFADYQKQVPFVKRIVERVRQFLGQLRNALRGNGFTTPESVFQKAASGKLKPTKEATKAPVEKPLEPSGKPVNTDSPEFKKWFGDSIFVDKNGKPQVLYHGTKADIDEFRVGDGAFGKGIYLATDPDKASTYAKHSFGKAYQPMGPEGGNVLPLYVSMSNPKIKDTDVFKVKGPDGKTMPIAQAAKYITDQAKAEGHDGIILKDPSSGKITEVIAFESSQLKSAISNVGNFSRENPNIRYEVPSRAKLKAPMQGVDAAYAEKLRKQFSQEKATVKEKFESLKKNFFDRMMTGIFDEFRAIKKYDDKSYMMARLSKSIDGALHGLLEFGHVFNDGGALQIKPNTKGLLKILEPIGAEVDQYQIWKALSRDAAMPSDKRSFDAELVNGRDNLVKGDLNGKPRKAVYEQALREENELNKSVLKVALDAGIIDQAGYDRFSKDIYYIPFYKQMEDGDVQSISASSKLTGQYFSKELKGGAKKTNDLMENVLLNWSHILSASMKNQAARETIKSAAKMGAAEQATMVAGKYPSGTVKVMEDGKPAHYELSDPDLVDAISTISYLGPKSAFLDVAKGFTNALRYGITMNPAYKVRNLIRDSIQSAAISELGPNVLNNVYNGMRLTDKGNPTFMAALAGGGIFEMGVAHEGNQAKLIKRLIDKGVDANSILDTPEKIKAKLQSALDWYNEQGNRFENANRLALYQKLIDSGKTHLEASYAARDLMDFSMQGQFRAIKVIGSVVPFFNARLQGLYKLGKDGITPTYRVVCNATTGKPLEIGDKQKAARFFTMTSAVALASMALYGMYKDDEDFKRREDWDRDNFWWFKIGDTIMRIPKPFEIGAFGTVAERVYEQIADENVEGKVFFERMNSILANTFSMNPTPQMVKPLIDLYANKDSFTGAPIESGGMENLSKQERINNNTSGLAIAMGGISQAAAKVLTFNPDAEGFSPIQMDYAMKAYLGWLGATAASTADLAIEPFQEGTKVRKPIIDTLAMGFIKTEPETQSKYMTEFYQNNAQFQSALADMRHYAEMGDSEKVQQIIEDKGDKIALAKVYDKTSKQFSALRKQSRLIEQNTEMDSESKRLEMNRIKILMSDMAAQMEAMRLSLKNK